MDQYPPSAHTMLKIGEIIAVGDEKKTIWTVLGSCISVIFHVPRTVSILCHAQMPSRENQGIQCFEHCPHPCFKRQPDSMDGRYVSCSVELMVKKLNEKKIPLGMVNTTLIGGAATIVKAEGSEAIGNKNVETAKRMLSMHGLTINRELTGGLYGYTMWFKTADGRLFVRMHDRKEKVELLNETVKNRAKP